jgi:hypothetical protein
MVTTFGIKNNEYASRLVQNSITMDALFEVWKFPVNAAPLVIN